MKKCQKQLEQFILHLSESGHSPKTVKSIKERLSALLNKGLLSNDANKMNKILTNNYSQRSKLATWSDLTKFYDYLQATKQVDPPNPFKKFKSLNKSLFKSDSNRQHINFTFDEAKEMISKIKDPRFMAKATELLHTGLRWQDSLSIDQNGYCVQKGGKKRKVFVIGNIPIGNSTLIKSNYHAFLKALKKVGLKPHDLRKIFANHCVKELGLNVYEIQRLLGHSSINTSQYYVSVNDDSLQEKLTAA